jgi:hypothetical protein
MQAQLPQGRVRLAQTHTFVAGGLASLVRSPYRTAFVRAVDGASKTCGALLFVASRLLLLYAVDVLERDGGVFPETGLKAGKNEKWATSDPETRSPHPPVVFTQELCEWSLNVFFRSTKRSPRDSHPAFIRLKALAAPLVAEFGLRDNSHLQACLQSLAKSLSVVVANHLNVACAAHTAVYLRAKYDHLYLTKKEASQLAKTVGRSVQWNAARAAKQPGGAPYDVLPPVRAAKVWRRRSGDVNVPAVTVEEWRSLVEAERALLPPTWNQSDMVCRRWDMLRAIRTGEDAAAPRAGFTLVPLCRAGRVFLKLNTAGLHALCLRAGISIQKTDVLNLFDAKRLDRVLRRPTTVSDDTVPLHLAGEFFRTDGLQAQFVCGAKRGEKRARNGDSIDDDDGDEDGEAPDGGIGVCGDESDEEIEDDPTLPVRIEILYSCDPGKENLYNVASARELGPDESGPPGLQPLGDGRRVVWKEVLHMSKAEWDEIRGMTKRRKQRTAEVRSNEAYRAALGEMSRNSAAVADGAILCQRLLAHCRSHAALHAFEGSRDAARTRFAAYMGKQKAFAKVASDFKKLLGAEGVCAWGGARWAHASKGRAPCPAAAIYRYLVRQPWAAGRFPREAECNTSCKCSNCLAPEKMVHPHHARTYRYVWSRDANGHLSKTKVGAFGGGRPNGLYQCQTGGCNRTWSRDRNAPANIWRCYWERFHGRARPETLRSSRAAQQQQNGDGPSEMRAATGDQAMTDSD